MTRHGVFGLAWLITSLGCGGEVVTARASDAGVGAAVDGAQGDGAPAGDGAGGPLGVLSISLGGRHACAVLSTGIVRCWGQNAYGQLGDGTTTDHYIAADVKDLGGTAIQVAAGGDHVCALMSTGAVRCWGAVGSPFGQVGNGDMAGSLVPVDVVNLGGKATQVAAGWNHTCALLSTGAVRCWGGNDQGQLGDGTYGGSKPYPVDVVALTGKVTQVAAANGNPYETCAVLDSGQLACWQPAYFSLDLGGAKAAQVSLSSGTGAYFSMCVALLGGAVRCNGLMGSSQLKDAAFTYPAQYVAADESVACILSSTGYIECLGQGGNTTAPVEVDVGGTAVQLVGTWGNSCVILSSGAVRCWGGNASGQLGQAPDGTLPARLTPTSVPGLP